LGEAVQTQRGAAYRIEESFGLAHLHGDASLGDLLAHGGEVLAEVAGQPSLQQIGLNQLVFLDTETTGLAGGAGTLIFLVGVGIFEGDIFRLRQYFLHDPAEEAAMLCAVEQDLQAAAGFMTFNGRAFDVPLLEMRYMLGLRKYWPLTTWPNVDLLHPSRRLWGRILPDCSLSTLEREILQVQRGEADVPGWEIPQLYLEYLHTGDEAAMERVAYHNAMDVLSLVVLAEQVVRRHQRAHLESLSDAEALAVARWHQRAGRSGNAESAYLQALASPGPALHVEAVRRFSGLLKREGRYEKALEAWKMWHALDGQDPTPCVELAKHYEWRVRDYAAALHWAGEALDCLAGWPNDWRRGAAEQAIGHRLSRLERKRGAQQT
jgi:uncharacterized protein YprB with RNaseH-like and TPR domain